MSIRLLLADDHKVVRGGFRCLLESEADMEVVGEAGDGQAAVRLTLELSPDVVVMDVAMPALNGIDATRQIVRDAPGVKVLALSMHPSRRIVKQMLQAGATGYLVKTCSREELVRAVRVVTSGKTYLSPEVAGGVTASALHGSADGDPISAVLSDREREVLQRVAEGKSTKEIASALHVSVKTVEAHRQNLMQKLDIHTIAELTKYAVREGLTPLDG